MLKRVGAAFVAPRHERRFRARDRLQRRNGIVGTGNMGRVGARPDHNEIVPRDLPTVDAIAGGDKFLLGIGVMNQNEVGVVAGRRLQRLTRSLSQDMHAYAGLLGEAGRMCASRPEFSTEVVDARMID